MMTAMIKSPAPNSHSGDSETSQPTNPILKHSTVNIYKPNIKSKILSLDNKNSMQ